MSDRRTRIEELFDAVMDLPEDERAAYIDGHCGSEEIRAEVLSLLRFDIASDSMLQGSLEPSAHTSRAGTTNESIPGYELLEVLGEGGMGLVFLAEQLQPLRRRVAVKIIKLGMDTKEVIGRFETERQILAMLDHPHVAKVLDAGSTESGRSFFAMEYVPGMPVTDYSDDQRLPVPERLELFLDVCGAIQHAHQKGVIHRDIKPSNVLVTNQRVAKVIDFGVAKATAHGLTEQTHYTTTRQLIGTPEYMSPEQAGTPLEVDTRSDVYSLGVLLYELLAGAPPFDPETLRAAPYDEVCRKIREEDPPTPSTRISELGGPGSTSVAERRRAQTSLNLVRSLRGDLDWITMKAMDKDLSRRYSSAAELAADIRRHLSDQPVVAGPPTLRYRWQKFVRRNRTAVLASASIAVAIVLGLVLSVAGFITAERQRQRAELSEQREMVKAETATTVVQLLQSMFRNADPHRSRGQSYTLRQLLDEYSQDLEREMEGQPEVEGALQSTVGLAYEGLGDLERAERHLRRGLDLKRASTETSAHDLAMTLRDYGWVLHRLGDYQAPEALYREALAIWEEGPNPNHVGIADIHFVLGDLHKHREQLSESELHYEEALGLLATLEGEESRVAQCQYYLANLRNTQGRHREADELYRNSLRSARALEAAKRPWRIANVAFSFGTFLRERAEYEEAEPLLREALTLRERYYGDHDPSVGGSRAGLGKLLMLQGDYDAAEPLLRAAVASFQEHNDDEDIAEVQCLIWWGELQHARGAFMEAERHYRRALSIADEKMVGAVLRASARDWLGSLLLDRGALDEAEVLFREALALRVNALCADDGISKSHNNIAVVLIRRGDFDGALGESRSSLESLLELTVRDDPELQETANDVLTLLDERTRAEGAPEMKTLLLRVADLDKGRALALMNALSTFSRIAQKRGEAENSADTYRALADVREHLLGETHPSVAASLSGLGESLLMQRKPADAVRVLRQAVAVEGAVFRVSSLVQARVRLARALDATGDREEAEHTYRQAVAELEGTHGPDHDLVGVHLNNLGLMLRARGEFSKAEVVFRESLRIAQLRNGDDHPSVTAALNNVAMTRRQQQDLIEARALFERALAGRRSFHGDIHASVATTAMNLGDVLQSLSDLDGALALYREAATTFIRVFPNGHPRTAIALSKIGVLCVNRDELEDAEDAFRRCAELRERLFGAGHPTVIVDLNNLGYGLLRRDKLVEAEEQLRKALRSNTRLPDDDSAIDGVRFNLARALLLGGNAAEAEPFLRRSLEVRLEKYAEGHDRIRSARTELALTLHALGMSDEAAKVFVSSGFDTESSAHDWPFDSAFYSWHLGCLLSEHGILPSAEASLRTALATPVPSGSVPLDLVEIQCELSEVIWRQDRHGEAEKILLDVHAAMQDRDVEDSDIKRVTRAVVGLYEHWDKPEKAREWRERSRTQR